MAPPKNSARYGFGNAAKRAAMTCFSLAKNSMGIWACSFKCLQPGLAECTLTLENPRTQAPPKGAIQPWKSGIGHFLTGWKLILSCACSHTKKLWLGFRAVAREDLSGFGNMCSHSAKPLHSRWAFHGPLAAPLTQGGCGNLEK